MVTKFLVVTPLCLDDQLPTTPSDCFFAKNRECLAGFAGTIERSIRESPLCGGI